MSRSRKGAPSCPSKKCDWCGGKASADHRHARHIPTPDAGQTSPPPTALDLEYDKREREYEAWLDEQSWGEDI